MINQAVVQALLFGASISNALQDESWVSFMLIVSALIISPLGYRK